MARTITLFLSAFFFIAGCETSDSKSDSHFDKVSREIEHLKAESMAAASQNANIIITVNLLSTSVDNQFIIDSAWKYVNQNVKVVKRPGALTRSGLRIGVGGNDFKAQLDIAKNKLKSSEETEMFLAVSDGFPGYINIGKEIYVPRFYYHGRWYSIVDYQFRQAGRSLKVVARRLPSGSIEMELTPVFSNFLNNGGDIELTELSTKVIAQPGQTIALGGSDSSDESVATALLGYSRQAQKNKTLITVTAQSR